MARIRRHPVTGDSILFAPERAARPHEGDGSRCPFCPGNESDTPPEITRRGEPWRVRAFPNKYPAAPGHEVIVESREHDASFADVGDPAEIVDVYAERYRAHEDAAYVALFKNHGRQAGASLPHLHSQLLPLPFVPPVIQRHIEGFERARSCPLCEPAGEVMEESAAFIRIAPLASQHAWEQWVIPKNHRPTIDPDCGDMVKTATAAAERIAAAYNVNFFHFPRTRAAHFYVSVIPRTTAMAGFELGTGTFIDIVDPVEAARLLR